MKNRILSKNKGRLFFLFAKICQLPKYWTMFARKIFSPELGGGGQLPLSFPASCTYGTGCCNLRNNDQCNGMRLISTPHVSADFDET